MRLLAIFLAAFIGLTTLFTFALAEPISKSGAVQVAEGRDIEAIGPPWRLEYCCRPGCQWCAQEPCSINDCNMPGSFPFDICCAITVSRKRDENGLPLHAFNEAGEAVTFVSDLAALPTTFSTSTIPEPTPTAAVQVAKLSPITANQLEDRMTVEEYCCFSYCRFCAWIVCSIDGCDPYTSAPWNSCCAVEISGKRGLDGLPTQAFNQAGESVTFVSDLAAFAATLLNSTSTTLPQPTPAAAVEPTERRDLEKGEPVHVIGAA